MLDKKFSQYYVNHISVNIDEQTVEKIKSAKITYHSGIEYKNIKKIQKDDAVYDVELFFDILKYCYSGYEYYNDIINFDNLKNEIVASLPKTASTKIIRNLLHKALSKYINDSHFGFIIDDKKAISLGKLYRAYFTSLVVGLKNGVYTVIKGNKIVKKGYIFTHEQIKDFLFETLPGKNGDKRYIIGVYTTTSVKRLVICGFDLPVHPCKTDNYKMPNEAVKTEIIGDIPVIHHSTYSNSKIKAPVEEYKEMGIKYKNTDRLIWSILSNGGGNSNFPENFIYGLNNNAVWELDLAVINNPIINKSDKNKKSYSIFNTGKIDFSKSEYNGRLFVLQNKYVGSSGEAAVMYGRNVKNVCFVGGATMGCGQFGDILTYKLPNSHIYFSMGYKVFNMEGFEEGKGFFPDYWIDSENPLEIVAEFINCL